MVRRPEVRGPRLTLVVPATDSPSTLHRCLEHVRAAEEPPEELVVVDLPAESGPADARNRGARSGTGEILVFVDADVCVHPDAFRRLRARFAADPSLTAVFGSYDDSPAANGVVSAFRNLLHHHVHQSSHGPAVTFWAGLGAVRRSAFVEVGGFDAERCPRFVEDVELGMRLTAAGARVELDRNILGTHLKPWTLATMLRTDVAGRALPWLELLLEERRAPATLNLGWRHRLSAAASLMGAAATLARRPRAAVTSGAALVALNAGFYRLLMRRRGPAEAAAGVGLHALHHLAGAAALPLALARLTGRRAGGPARAASGGARALTPVRSLAREDPSWTSQMAGRAAEAAAAGEALPLRHTWVGLERVASPLAEAVVAAEDSEFENHRGVDWAQVGRAARQNLRERSLRRSASTITMQLAKNLYLPGPPTLRRKLAEAVLASRLEAGLSKRRVLELYLNLIEWGPSGLFGAEEAARHHFGRGASELGLEDTVELAAVIPICPAGFDRAGGAEDGIPLREVIAAEPLLRGRRRRIEHAVFHGQGRGGADRLRAAVARAAVPNARIEAGAAQIPGPFVEAVPGSPGAAALTFDGGPDPRATPALLDALDAHGLRATFFLAPAGVAENPELSRAIADRGHEIGLHYGGAAPGGHQTVDSQRTELKRAVSVVEDVAGFVPRFWRPDRASLEESCPLAALGLDLTPVRRAGGGPRAQEGLAEGAIACLDHTAAALEAVVALAAAAGEQELRLVSLGQCLALAATRPAGQSVAHGRYAGSARTARCSREAVASGG